MKVDPLREHSALVVSVRPGQTFVVDVSSKYHYDTLTRVAMMITMRLNINPELMMHF